MNTEDRTITFQATDVLLEQMTTKGRRSITVMCRRTCIEDAITVTRDVSHDEILGGFVWRATVAKESRRVSADTSCLVELKLVEGPIGLRKRGSPSPCLQQKDEGQSHDLAHPAKVRKGHFARRN